MFDYSTLIYDRTAQDVEDLKALLQKRSWAPEEAQAFLTQIHKGGYSYMDVNRVVSAMDALSVEMLQVGYSSSKYKPLSDQNTPDTPAFRSQINQIVRNLQTIRTRFIMYPDTPQAPQTMENLDIQMANAIEKIIKDAHEILQIMPDLWYYSGELMCGEV